MKTDKPSKPEILDALVVLLDSDSIGLRPVLELAFDAGLQAGIVLGRDREKKDAAQRVSQQQMMHLQQVTGAGGGGARGG